MYERLKFLSPSFSQVKKTSGTCTIKFSRVTPLNFLASYKAKPILQKTKLIFGYQIDVTFNHQIAE